MKRSTQSLAGTWQFQTDPDGQLTVQTLQLSQTIPVPLPWQAAHPDLQKYGGYAGINAILRSMPTRSRARCC
jgi:hypothetical protein